MKAQGIFGLAVCVISLVCATAAIAADLPPPPAQNACTEKDERISPLLESLNTCLIGVSLPLYVSVMKPDAIADAALAGCREEQDRLRALTLSCRSRPFDPSAFRQMILTMVANRRARADFLWDQGRAWRTGACSVEDKEFEALTDAHLDCMMKSDPGDSTPAKSLGSLADSALTQCMTQESAIRARVSACQNSDAPRIMSAYRAFAQEILFANVLDQLHKQGAPKEAPTELSDDQLLRLVAMYESCLIMEAKAASARGGEADAILRTARQICATARMDMHLYAQAHLSAALLDALLETVDDEAMTMAKAELEVAGVRVDASPRN